MNKRSVVYGVMVLITAIATSGVAKDLAIVNAAGLDQDLVDRLEQFGETSLRIAITSRNEELDVESFDDAAETVSATLSEDHELAVVFWSPGDPDESHGTIKKDLDVAVVNVNAMQADDKETYARRLERQMMRGFGFLLGLDYSPNPRSALWNYSTLDELDEIGRNFDPPFLGMAQDAARERGIKVLGYQEMMEAGDAPHME